MTLAGSWREKSGRFVFRAPTHFFFVISSVADPRKLAVNASRMVTSNIPHVTRANSIINTLITTPLPFMPPKSRARPTASVQKRKRRDIQESEDEGLNASLSEDEVQALDSDNLDHDGACTVKGGTKAETKRKRKKNLKKPEKRRKKARSEDEESDLELKEGQEVVGKIVRAPKTGQGG